MQIGRHWRLIYELAPKLRECAHLLHVLSGESSKPWHLFADLFTDGFYRTGSPILFTGMSAPVDSRTGDFA